MREVRKLLNKKTKKTRVVRRHGVTVPEIQKMVWQLEELLDNANAMYGTLKSKLGN
jgi:hypothetical protein